MACFNPSYPGSTKGRVVFLYSRWPTSRCFNPSYPGSTKGSINSHFFSVSVIYVSIQVILEVPKEVYINSSGFRSLMAFQSKLSWKYQRKCVPPSPDGCKTVVSIQVILEVPKEAFYPYCLPLIVWRFNPSYPGSTKGSRSLTLGEYLRGSCFNPSYPGSTKGRGQL
jgi:hypothetical protein